MGEKITKAQAVYRQTIADIAESVEHMNVKGQRKEMAKAVIRAAIQYAAMKRGGFTMVPAKTDDERSI